MYSYTFSLVLFSNTFLYLNSPHLYPGYSLLCLHHPGGFGGLALTHQLSGAQVSGPEQDALYQNFGVSHRTCGYEVISFQYMSVYDMRCHGIRQYDMRQEGVLEHISKQ